MFSRGFVTAALLILIALASLAVARRLEREYRLLAKLRARADVPAAGIGLEELSAQERDTALDLEAAGVLRPRGGRHYIDMKAYAGFRRNRLRLALGGSLGTLLLCVAIIFVMLRR